MMMKKDEDEIVKAWSTLYFDDYADEPESNQTFSLFQGVDWEEEEVEPPVEETRFSGFRVDGEIGRGGVGLIEMAEQKSMVRFIAIKTALQPEHQASLVREAKITGGLSHPNIIPVYDVLEGEEGDVGITMPFVQGKPWSVRRTEEPKLTLEEELDILIRVSLAIEYAHERGVLHNDIKMENIMVGEHGNIIVMDWGCATSTDRYTMTHIPITPSKSIKNPFGTPCYMSPELASGDGEKIGIWSDVYQLGGLLYEILENRPPRNGDDITEVILKGVRGWIDPMTCDSSYLRSLCLHAMQANPQKRIQRVQVFVDRLRTYSSIQASETLAQQAEYSYNFCKQATEVSIQSDKSILLELQKTIYTYEQAEKVGATGSQAQGIEKTRILLIQTAIELGDLSLAKVHLDCLPFKAHAELRAQVLHVEKERLDEEKTSRRNRLALIGMSLLLMIGLIAGNIVVRNQRVFAEEKLKKIEELSGIQLYQELMEKEKLLWPAIPTQIDAMENWLAAAKELTDSLPKHEQHILALEKKRESHIFDRAEKRWEYQTLKKLVSGLKTLKSETIVHVKNREKLAKALHKKTIIEPKAKWEDAIASIAASPVYNGLQITPQIGLIPLSKNKQGLWEFAHILSGQLPLKNDDGEWGIQQETCIVLVLLPKAVFWMGAGHKPNEPNFDARAADIEKPVHEVSLDAFFISKYELTQSQWLRVQQENPSAYLPGQEQGGVKVSHTHPAEHMTWEEAYETLWRMDLILPTEAQWEYANRAGTQTVYWGGNNIADMRGRLNISDRLARERGSPASWKFEKELDDGHTIHAPIGRFEPNNFGLHDTSGNVWEWCLDRFGAYTLPTRVGDGMRMVDGGEERYIFRGGGFRASSVHARSADRYSIYAQDYSAYDVGIRPARALNP